MVTSGKELVVTDATGDPLLCANLAIPDLGVMGYAGMPLTDADGLVLGSLCAIDTVPRDWTPDELDILRDLAAACSSELRLRAPWVSPGNVAIPWPASRSPSSPSPPGTWEPAW